MEFLDGLGFEAIRVGDPFGGDVAGGRRDGDEAQHHLLPLTVFGDRRLGRQELPELSDHGIELSAERLEPLEDFRMNFLGAAALLDAMHFPTEEVAFIEREAIGFPRAKWKAGGLEKWPASLRDL